MIGFEEINEEPAHRWGLKSKVDDVDEVFLVSPAQPSGFQAGLIEKNLGKVVGGSSEGIAQHFVVLRQELEELGVFFQHRLTPGSKVSSNEVG